MEILSHTATTMSMGSFETLPEDRCTWPCEAENSYTEVVRELDHWCRENNSPMVMNSWVAEEAVRQVW